MRVVMRVERLNEAGDRWRLASRISGSALVDGSCSKLESAPTVRNLMLKANPLYPRDELTMGRCCDG